MFQSVVECPKLIESVPSMGFRVLQNDPKMLQSAAECSGECFKVLKGVFNDNFSFLVLLYARMSQNFLYYREKFKTRNFPNTIWHDSANLKSQKTLPVDILMPKIRQNHCTVCFEALKKSAVCLHLGQSLIFAAKIRI